MPPDQCAAHDAAVAGRILTAWAVQQLAAAQPHPPMQLAAAAALRELASAGRDSIMEIAAAGGIPALGALLSSDSAPAASKAAALVALRRLSSQQALFGEVAGAVSMPACLQLLRGDSNSNGIAAPAAAAALLTSLAAGSEQLRQEAVAAGAAPLLLQHVMHGSMQGGVWQPSNSPPHALEFAASRALHALHPGAPVGGLRHADLWQMVGQLDSSAVAEDVQERAVEACIYTVEKQFPEELLEPSPEKWEQLQRLMTDRELARSLKLLLLLRAGAIPQLLSLLQTSTDGGSRYRALAALSILASGPDECKARAAPELIAAGAVPMLMHEAGNSSADGQLEALHVLGSLAEHSAEHRAALHAQIMPILVGCLHSWQGKYDVHFAAGLLAKLMLTSDAACKAATKAGAIPAFEQHSHFEYISRLLHAVQERCQELHDAD